MTACDSKVNGLAFPHTYTTQTHTHHHKKLRHFSCTGNHKIFPSVCVFVCVLLRFAERHLCVRNFRATTLILSNSFFQLDIKLTKKFNSFVHIYKNEYYTRVHKFSFCQKCYFDYYFSLNRTLNGENVVKFSVNCEKATFERLFGEENGDK